MTWKDRKTDGKSPFPEHLLWADHGMDVLWPGFESISCINGSSTVCGQEGRCERDTGQSIALNGVIWMYLPEIMHMSKPRDCSSYRGDKGEETTANLGRGPGGGRKELPTVLPEYLPWFCPYLNYGAIFSCILQTGLPWLGSSTSLSLGSCSYKTVLKIAIILDAWVAQWLSVCLSPGRDPGNPGSSPMSGCLHGACFSLCLCLCVSHE